MELPIAAYLLPGFCQGPWNVDLRTPPGPEGSNGSLLRIRRGHPGTLSLECGVRNEDAAQAAEFWNGAGTGTLALFRTPNFALRICYVVSSHRQKVSAAAFRRCGGAGACHANAR